MEVARIVRLNDLFADYLRQPLTARLRRDETLAAAVAGIVPDLSGPAIGIAVRLLSRSRRVDGDLAAYIRARLAAGDLEDDGATYDPLNGTVCHVASLFLDVLDTIGD